MFPIDYKSGLPIFEQIYRSVVKLGAAGAFGPGGQLPSVRAVAKDLGVNPNTVQKAYAMLERDGVLYSVPGKGSFLAEPGAVLEKRREEALLQVRQALAGALECGVGREEILAVLTELEKEG
ncbi:GntR family transcriptional regulator [bacterium D16-76]|nr:GntR family transcriptional regulator [bacterium D16-76]